MAASDEDGVQIEFGGAHPGPFGAAELRRPTTWPRKPKKHTLQGGSPMDSMITPCCPPSSLDAAIFETEKAHLNE